MMRTNIDGLRSRLVRLGKLAGTEACPRCRLLVRHTWPGDEGTRQQAEDPSPIVTTRCEMCGAPRRFDLSIYPEELREMARLYHASTLEDLFTDPRAWAARRWMIHFVAVLERRRREELHEARRRAATKQPANRPHYDARGRAERERAREKDPEVKLYERLLAEAQALDARRRRRLERRYGKNPFPDIEARVAEVSGLDNHGTPAERLERAGQQLSAPGPAIQRGLWFVCAEMEKIVLGGVSAYTAGQIEEGERRAKELLAQIDAQHEQFMEMLRQRDEATERRHPERQATAAPQPDPPPASTPDTPPAPAFPGPYPTGKRSHTLGGRPTHNQSPAPPQNVAPAAPAPAPVAPLAPPRPRPKRARTLQDCWRLMEENDRRRRP